VLASHSRDTDAMVQSLWYWTPQLTFGHSGERLRQRGLTMLAARAARSRCAVMCQRGQKTRNAEREEFAAVAQSVCVYGF
jgi:hypothetical protein